MTVSIDTDGDGDPDAVFPLKWLILLLPLVLTMVGLPMP
jgi:hypothetical protein